MTKGSITLEFKKSEEYKELSRMVRSMNPDLPEYLVDLSIGMHKAFPSAYRQFKGAEKTSMQRSPSVREFVINDAVSIMNPTDASNE